MAKFLILLSVFFLHPLVNGSKLLAQEEVVESRKYTTVLEVPPTFIGGNDSMIAFIERNIVYPKQSIQLDEEGVVYITFTVNVDSTVSFVNANAGANELLVNEAKRILMLTNKKWIPGKINGKYVRSYCKLPITFELEDDEIYKYVEVQPSFIPKSGIQEFIKNNQKWPAGSDDSTAQEIPVRFVINADATVSEIQADTSIRYNNLFLEEAFRIVLMTNNLWTPAKIKDKPVRFQMQLLFRFKP